MKPEIVFGLEAALWPSMVIASGMILRANPAAQNAFGAAVSGDSPKFETIWSPENGVASEDFLTMWEMSPLAVQELKFKTADGKHTRFTVAISVFSHADNKWFVVQLMPVFDRPLETTEKTPTAAPASKVVASSSERPSPDGKPSPDGASAVLKQKLECALQLARSVSLDFNNVLTSVIGHTSLLLSKVEPAHPWRKSLMEIEKASERAAEIANELQTFSRQEKEQMKGTPTGNLNAVATRCVDVFKNAHGDKIIWSLQLEKSLFGSKFDEAKIQQALTKILENAAEAVTPGKGKISVQTRNVDLKEPTQDRNVKLAAGCYVCIEVADNGCGITPDVLPRIFEPFFTTKGGSHRGLGLALVYGIVTNHGGGVAVSSDAGKGAATRIYLPAEKSVVQESSLPTEALHGKGTILVVDDESILLTMVETILTEYGYKVITTNSGVVALEILKKPDMHIDAVLTDLVMPAMSGRELVEHIRQESPAMRLLCMSGYIVPADKKSGIPYLQKPFTTGELLTKVKQLLP